MRRAVLLLALAATLVLASAAAAALQPIRRDFAETARSRVITGPLRVSPQQRSGRVRVIVTLRLAPLAAAHARTLALRPGVRRRLDATSAFSRGYLAQVDAAQRRAIAALGRVIPEAHVTRRYRIVLDGFVVSLPVRRLTTLFRLGFLEGVYPSRRYTQSLNRSPEIIAAPQLSSVTGARGDGVKIAIVDDGVDQRSPFFDPAGFAYPPSFPRGQASFTTPKVIAARSFPGPGSGDAGKLPLDREASFHGTHVAGIAAGNAGTSAAAGPDHPAVSGLSGVAPRAWLGNYRVFNVPIPLLPGVHFAETPEIVAAFEAAVADGMDVVNFSGGGPESDPVTDALIEAVRNVAAAGVVPVISAGNDRDEFGFGTVGAPGTAPDAITVAAVSNTHVFGPALTVLSPGVRGLPQVPYAPGRGGIPNSWTAVDQTVLDVGTLTGTDGRPVDRHLCGPESNPNAPESTLRPGALAGAIALVSRGFCSFSSKAERVEAADGGGMLVVDNRPGEANPIPAVTFVPAAMIADLDGARIREAAAAAGGRVRVRFGRSQLEIATGRSGVPTSFSAGGPTAFGHDLKPDLAAPGGQILSATVPEFVGTPFAVFDGTSMSAPHVAGAAALLRQRHPAWTPKQVKSALMSTAGPAYADTARTTEAPVLLEGAGLIRVTEADDPRIFTDPPSLSFRDLDVSGGGAAWQIPVTVTDAGGGSGTWQVEVRPQSAGAGAGVEAPGSVVVGPGGSATAALTARAAAGAAPGDDYGFVVLRSGELERRIPYYFSVTRPRLAEATAIPLRRTQAGDTRRGGDRVRAYRFPTAPFGPPPSYTGQAVDEDGGETVYVTELSRPAVNVGVAVVDSSQDSIIDPWFLGSLDENDVQGYAGTPVNVNGVMFYYGAAIGAAGATFATPGRYYVAVDSGRDVLTGRPLGGRYVLRSWVDDLEPPQVRLLTTRVAAGRPTVVLRALDPGAGVDPFSIAIRYGETTILAAAFDAKTGIAVVPIPPDAPSLGSGARRLTLIVSDFQEAKNVNVIGPNAMPNTALTETPLRVVTGPAISWILPEANSCAARQTRLGVAASDTNEISSVIFYADGRRVARVRTGEAGIYTASWNTRTARRGRHVLEAAVFDTAGRQARAKRVVRVCRK